MKRLTVGALLACTVVLVLVEVLDAQVFIRGGGRYGTSVGVYTPGFAFSYGDPYYGRYGYGGYGYGPYRYGYGSRFYDYGYGPSYYGYGRSYYYSPYSYYGYRQPYYGGYYSGWSSPYYGGSYSGYTATYPGAGYMNSGSYQSGYSSAPQSQGNAAFIRVIVPPNAKVWFGDHETQQQGPERRFVSPPLEPGYTYTYTIRASWMENGKEVSRDKSVNVLPGREAMVNFTDEQREAIPQPGTRPDGLLKKKADQ